MLNDIHRSILRRADEGTPQVSDSYQRCQGMYIYRYDLLGVRSSVNDVLLHVQGELKKNSFRALSVCSCKLLIKTLLTLAEFYFNVPVHHNLNFS